MLDAISDFWKPAKKGQAQEKLRPEQLQVGSSIGFGFVPQASLSGRRLQVTVINTYRFGDESLTSFAMTQDKDAGVSMIVAESEGEHYLALSRRLTISDRMKMFESADLEDIMDKQEKTTLACKDSISDFKGWVVASYKREIQGLKGLFYKGDFRKAALPAAGEAQEFKYTLLVSESNEHAIEIEKYNDGRVEVYATVYRRLSDIGEVSHPVSRSVDIKLASKPEEKQPVAETKPAPLSAQPFKPAPVVKTEEAVKPAGTKTEPVKLQELSAPATSPVKPVEMKTQIKPEMKPEPKAVEVVKAEPAKPAKEEKPMATMEAAANGSDKNKPAAPVMQASPAQLYTKQEVKAVSKTTTNGMDNESIECDLRVANKIIDEAIRSEMRLSDVVRRIVELPVAHQEAVHIPIMLSDEDYSLLAIRYSISASDRNAIKKRMIEDLNDFSGKKAA